MNSSSNRELLFLVPGVQPGETREEFAKRAVEAVRKTGIFDRFRNNVAAGRLAARVDESNADHHLWNNNGTWWFHCTVHLPDYTSRRIRRSLGTKDVAIARRRRDDLLNGLKEGGETE